MPFCAPCGRHASLLRKRTNHSRLLKPSSARTRLRPGHKRCRLGFSGDFAEGKHGSFAFRTCAGLLVSSLLEFSCSKGARCNSRANCFLMQAFSSPFEIGPGVPVHFRNWTFTLFFLPRTTFYLMRRFAKACHAWACPACFACLRSTLGKSSCVIFFRNRTVCQNISRHFVMCALLASPCLAFQ